MDIETYVRLLNEWVALFHTKSAENDTHPCRHGHVGCSTYKGGRCFDETLVQIDAALDKWEAQS